MRPSLAYKIETFFDMRQKGWIIMVNTCLYFDERTDGILQRLGDASYFVVLLFLNGMTIAQCCAILRK